jgi:hypothetical protein
MGIIGKAVPEGDKGFSERGNDFVQGGRHGLFLFLFLFLFLLVERITTEKKERAPPRQFFEALTAYSRISWPKGDFFYQTETSDALWAPLLSMYFISIVI